MRLFIGIEIGQRLAEAAAALIDQLQRRASRLAPGAKVTWIPPERLHLTVRFIGHADEARQRAIAAVLEPPLAVRSFDMVLGGTGTFPPRGQPSVIWAGLTGGLEPLQELEREVTLRLREAGVPAEDRPYNPHLTLARVRPPSRKRFGEAGPDARKRSGEAATTRLNADALLQGHRDVDLGAVHVEAITLFESRLSPKGPTYVALQQTPLRRT